MRRGTPGRAWGGRCSAPSGPAGDAQGAGGWRPSPPCRLSLPASLSRGVSAPAGQPRGALAVSDGSYGPTWELCCEKMVRGGARAAARVAGLSPRSHAAPRGLADPPPPHTHTLLPRPAPVRSAGQREAPRCGRSGRSAVLAEFMKTAPLPKTPGPLVLGSRPAARWEPPGATDGLTRGAELGVSAASSPGALAVTLRGAWNHQASVGVGAQGFRCEGGAWRGRGEARVPRGPAPSAPPHGVSLPDWT